MIKKVKSINTLKDRNENVCGVEMCFTGCGVDLCGV
jgi:hypothetical protein